MCWETGHGEMLGVLMTEKIWKQRALSFFHTHLCHLSFILFVPPGFPRVCLPLYVNVHLNHVCIHEYMYECSSSCQVEYVMHWRMASMNKQHLCHLKSFKRREDDSRMRGNEAKGNISSSRERTGSEVDQWRWSWKEMTRDKKDSYEQPRMCTYLDTNLDACQACAAFFFCIHFFIFISHLTSLVYIFLSSFPSLHYSVKLSFS